MLWSNYVKVFQYFDLYPISETPSSSAFFQRLGRSSRRFLRLLPLRGLNSRDADFLFAILLATMMIPGEMMVITNYITVASLGWLKDVYGVFAAMIVPFWVSFFTSICSVVISSVYRTSLIGGESRRQKRLVLSLASRWCRWPSRRLFYFHSKTHGRLELLRLAELGRQQIRVAFDHQRLAEFFHFDLRRTEITVCRWRRPFW